jgi:hypothetical protein
MVDISNRFSDRTIANAAVRNSIHSLSSCLNTRQLQFAKNVRRLGLIQFDERGHSFGGIGAAGCRAVSGHDVRDSMSGTGRFER